MKTSQVYINEHALFDTIIESIQECTKEVAMLEYTYEKNVKDAELKSFFEGTDVDVIIEKEGDSVLAKIGTVIVNLLKSGICQTNGN